MTTMGGCLGVITFLRLSYKAAVFKNLKNLSGINDWSNIYLNDDYTMLQKNQINEHRAISALARSKGHNSKVRGNVLIMDGRRYGYSDVAKLPDGINIENAKTLVIDGEKGIGFQSHHSFLSNMFDCDMVYDGIEFSSAEVVYQYIKAKECGTRKDVRAIVEANWSYTAKDVGKLINETPEWHQKKVQVMKEVVKAKFTSNPDLKQRLLATGTKDLYELTYDRFWGCGVPISKSYQVNSKNVPGANKLGKILMETRNELSNN